MKKKVKLADVLWEAANRWLLSEKDACRRYDGPPLDFSCNAAQVAEAGRYRYGMFLDRSKSRTITFLRELGCNPDQATAWKGRDVQGVRYMWLLLAMHVAEDEGIEIEVEA